MPPRRSHVPKYRKHKASGQAVCTINGKDFYLGPHNSKASRVEYDRLIAEWLSSERAITPGTEESSITVVECIVAYMGHVREHYKKNGKPTSEQRDITLSLRPVKELYSKIPAIEFGPVALRAVRHRMVESGLSRTVINQRVGRIRRMFQWCVSIELIPASIHAALETVDGLKSGRTKAHENDPILPVEDSVIAATVAHLPQVVADMVMLQRYTGMRPAEVCQIRPCDVDRTGQIWLYTPGVHKTQHHGKARIVFIGPRGQEILLRYLARAPESFCFQPIDSEAKRLSLLHENRTTPLSCGNRPGSNRKRKPKTKPGESYSTCTYRQAIYRAIEKAFPWPELRNRQPWKLKGADLKAYKQWLKDHHWSPHQLRHSYATEVRKRFGLESVQVTLGHSHAKTSEIYAERDMGRGIDVAKEIG